MTKKLLIVCVGAALAVAVLSTRAADDKKKASVDVSKLPPASDQKGVTYAKDIKPIFEKSCVKCHGAEKPKAKLQASEKHEALSFKARLKLELADYFGSVIDLPAD